MKLARSEGLGVLANGILIVCLLAALLELHLLRVAVETDGPWIDSGPTTHDRAFAALAEPLEAISHRLTELTDTAFRPVAPWTHGTDPSIDPATAATTSPPRGAQAARAQRREVPTAGPSGADAAVRSLTKLIEDLAQRPLVAKASIPPASSGEPIDAGAVGAVLAAVRGSQVEKSRLLLATPADLLARYGKPTSFSVGEGGEVNWWYELAGGGDYLHFELYDGRVIDIEWND